jgi:hypothetical protein
MVTAHREGTGAEGAMKALADAGFDVADSPYPAFISGCFIET